MSDDNRASCGCPTYWVEDKGKPYGDCPYCEIDRLRENIKHEIDFDQARINVEMENTVLRKALEDIADGNGDDCKDCAYNTKVALEALKRAGGGE